ncbi:MAG: aldo/keto reductase [Clostridia bacterium]|nr:aldo/keto reductase [Clostridia bacterium]
MKKVEFKRAGLTVSNICLGTMMYGTQVPEKDAFEQLDIFLDLGGNFIDTSNNYAHWWPGASGDESETLLGKWLSEKKCRDKVVIATKVGFDRHGEGAGLSAKQIEYWCDESLRKLKTDYIDLYYAHTDDMNTPIEETMEAFDRLVKKGKVRSIGASNFYTWRMCEAKHVAANRSLADYTVNQACYTYLPAKGGYVPRHEFNLDAGTERLRYLAQNDIPLVPYSCLAKGGYDDLSRLPVQYETGKRLDTLLYYAKELGLSPSALVIAWLIAQDRLPDRPLTVPLFSSSRTEHLKENFLMSDYILDDEILKNLTYAKN